MEALREKLGVEEWLVMGASWGSTVALYYAEKYPERTLGVIVANLWQYTKKSLELITNGGKAKDLFPEEWQKYKQNYGEDEILDKYHDAIMSDDIAVRNEHLLNYANWELATSNGGFEKMTVADINDEVLANFQILFHFYKNEHALEEGYLVKNADRLANLPVWIIHGEEDYLCPVDEAIEFSKAVPHAKTTIVPNAGHGTSTFPAIDKAMHQAVAEFVSMN
jgi:proline iminopeptidase